MRRPVRPPDERTRAFWRRRTGKRQRPKRTRGMLALTEATKEWLKPVGVHPTDRLRLALADEGKRFLATVFNASFTEASSAARYKFPPKVPERWEVKAHQKRYSDEFLFGATDLTVAVCDANFADDQLEFEDDDARLTYEFLRARILHQERLVERVAEWRRTGTYEPRRKYVQSPRADRQLSPYQLLGLDLQWENDGHALFMEQGTGKTPIEIVRWNNEALRCEGRMYRVLVVCPKNVRTNWLEEIQDFSGVPGQAVVIRGGEMKRKRACVEALVKHDDDSRWTAIIMSYEAASSMVEWLARLKFDLMILDEGHYCKGPNAKRTKRMLQLRLDVRRRAVLTGTPVCNHPVDLWSQLELLGTGYSGFVDYKKFRSFHAHVRELDRGITQLIGVQNVPFLRERLARSSFMVRSEEVLKDLPDRQYDLVEVEMGPEQAEVYDQVARRLHAEIEEDLASGRRSREMVIRNVLTKLLRLAQITSGFITWDAVVDPESFLEVEPKQTDRFDPNPKVEALFDLLRPKTPKDKTIVWACFRQDIRTIAARAAIEGFDAVTYYGSTKEADREEAVRRFNEDPACRLWIGNPGAGGTGVNLLGYPKEDPSVETNANHVVYFSQDWSSPKRSQSEKRAHRRGTREPVRVTDLCVPQTIDEEIRTRVLRKQGLAIEVADVREIMRRILSREREDA